MRPRRFSDGENVTIARKKSEDQHPKPLRRSESVHCLNSMWQQPPLATSSQIEQHNSEDHPDPFEHDWVNVMWGWANGKF